MSKPVPYLNTPGVVTKVLKRIQEAKAPDGKFTQDFMENILLTKGGNYRSFIPLAKKLGLLSLDGSPTALYHKFRNPKTSKAAMAEAVKTGYADLFAADEASASMDSSTLKGHIAAVTGWDATSSPVEQAAMTFQKLKEFADFKTTLVPEPEPPAHLPPDSGADASKGVAEKLGLTFGYNLFINLPASTDINVFNAIFKSLRENLLIK